MGIVRAKEPVAVRDPEIPGTILTLNPNETYSDRDAVVKAYPWAFIADENRIEDATNQPGRRRSTKRPDLS